MEAAAYQTLSLDLIQGLGDLRVLIWIGSNAPQVTRLISITNEGYSIVKDGLTRDEIHEVANYSKQIVDIVEEMMITAPFIPDRVVGSDGENVVGGLLDNLKIDPAKLIKIYNIVASVLSLWGYPIPPLPVPLPPVNP